MSSNLVIWPILLPLLTAGILVMFYKNVKAQRFISAVAAILSVVLAFYLGSVVSNQGIQVFFGGDWMPPYGITLVADMFSVIMVIFCSILALVCLFFAFKTIDPEREKTFFYPFVQFLMVGIYGSLLTGDMFNLFVFFEIMLLASFALLVLGSTKAQLRESFKYVVLNMVSAVLFIMALAMLYGTLGTLNMADAAYKISQLPAEYHGVMTLVGILFLIIFGMKAALFPLYFWLPRSYYVPPTVIATLIGGLLTKVGVYALVRSFTLIFVHDTAFTHNILLWMGAGAMFLGVLGAISQMDFKRILTYHIISQVGYMIMGLGLAAFIVGNSAVGATLALAGAIFHVVHNIIVKSCLFLLSGVTEEITGTTDLRKMGGLLKFFPLLGWTFFLAGLSMAGVPPLSGFFSKFLLLQGGLYIGNYVIVFVALGVGVLTLLSMMKIFMYTFWGEEKGIPEDKKNNSYIKLMPPALALMAISVAMGLGAEWVFGYIMMAAEQLMNPEIYINAVLTKE